MSEDLLTTGGETTPTPDTTTVREPDAKGMDGVASGDAGEVKPQEWLSGLSDDLKKNPTLNTYKDVEALAKAHVHLRSMVGANTLRKPSEHATPEERRKFMLDAFDVADDPEKYEVKRPEAVLDEDAFNYVKQKAFEEGVPPQMLQKVVDAFGEKAHENVEKFKKQVEDRNKSELQALQTELGAAFDDTKKYARLALRELAGERLESLEREIKAKGYQNSPELVRILAKAGQKLFTEDQMIEKTKASLKKTPDDLRQAIAEIESDPILLDKTHPNQNKLVKERQKLYDELYAEG